MQIMKKLNFYILFTTGVLVFTSCSVNKAIETDSIDYRDEYNWISLPFTTNAVDVFYVYPTISDNSTGSMDITNEDERALAKGIFNAQASVYDSAANVFAPYYRQMTTAVDVSEDSDSLATDTDAFKLGAKDVQDAFNYFIENLNDGRPFIIAGHSQGTMALIELIKNRFSSDSTLRNRLVAAYLIGYTVTRSDLDTANLNAAQRADDFGVVISYNTQSPTASRGPMLMDGAICINPLNWKTDATYADSLENIEAVFFNDSTGVLQSEVPNFCDAQINLDSGAVITNIACDTFETGYSPGVYHRYDYAFWYGNLRKNVVDRINAYMNDN